MSAIRRRELDLGSKLPSVRALAKELGIAPLTVQRAYELLNSLGYIEVKPQSGARVSSTMPITLGRQIVGEMIGSGPVNDFETVSMKAGVRSMASAVPDPRLMPQDFFEIYVREAVEKDRWSTYHADPAGHPELLAQISSYLNTDGLPTSPSEIVVVQDSLAAINLALEVNCRPGDYVVVQTPGRLFLKEVLHHRGLNVLEWRDWNFEHLAELVDLYRPTAAILAPDFGHATGECMPIVGRMFIGAVFKTRPWCKVIEDGAMRPIRFLDDIPPPVSNLIEGSLFVGSMSYAMCPAVKCGYICAQDRTKLAAKSQILSVGGSRVLQTALAAYMESGAYANHLGRILPKYQRRREAMVSALKNLDGEVKFRVPDGGLSLWLELPESVSVEKLFKRAIAKGVAFAPDSIFLHYRHGIRLSYGLLDESEIKSAIGDLGLFLSASTA